MLSRVCGRGGGGAGGKIVCVDKLNPQEINLSLCNVPERHHGSICVYVFAV